MLHLHLLLLPPVLDLLHLSGVGPHFQDSLNNLLRLVPFLWRSKALNSTFPTSPRPSRTTSVFPSNQVIRQIWIPGLLFPDSALKFQWISTFKLSL